MNARIQRPGRFLPVLVILAGSVFAPYAANAERAWGSPQARAIQAFHDAAAVTEEIEALITRRRGFSRYGDPVAVKLSESCGVAGCYYSHLVTQLLSLGDVVNTQSTSVSAVVKVSPIETGTVTLVELAESR